MPTATIKIDEIEYEVDYSIEEAEPDVGIMSDYVDEFEIMYINDETPTKEQEKEIYDNQDLCEKILEELNEKLDNLDDWWD